MAISEHIIQYLSDTKNAVAGAKELEKINAQIAQQIGSSYANATRIVGQSFDKVSQKSIKIDGQDAIQTVRQIGNVVQTSDGQFKNFIQTQTSINGQLSNTSGSLNNVTNQFVRTNVETEKGQKNFLTLGDNIKRLTERALLTIPVWLLLRSVIMGFFKSISDGFATLESQDRVLQKAKRNLQGTASEISANFEQLKKSAEELSLKTGESVEKIVTAFQRFATVGFGFEASLAGMNNATKLSVLLFGDVEETANAFARSMRVLVTNFKDEKKSAKEIEDVMALTAELWKTNAFEINELTNGLEKFAGTAKSMNLTARETVVLISALSTTGLNASRSGTILRTSFQKLEENLNKTASVLGIKVNPQVDRTFDVFTKVVNAIAKLKSTTGTISPGVTQAIQELFGGVRGGEPIRAIVADIDKINKELQQYIKTSSDITKFNKEFEATNEILANQIKQFHNINREISKAFISGVVGGDNFKESMEEINKILLILQRNAKGFGQLFVDVATFATMNIAGLAQLKISTRTKDIANFQARINEQIVKGLRGQLSDIELKDLVVQLVNIDSKKFKVNERTLNSLASQLSIQLKDATEQAPIEVDLNVEPQIKVGGFLISELARQDIAQVLVDLKLDELKTQGATNVQLLKAEDLMNRQLNIAETDLDILKRKLQIEQEINEEKRLQSKLSSDTMKLFDIAQAEGIDIAQKIGDVLAGNLSFDIFVRQGGQALEVFKKEFADLFKQQQAISFFKGTTVPGVEGLRGGTRIPIEEEALRKPITSAGLQTQLALARAPGQLTTIQQLYPNVVTTIKIDFTSLKEAEEKSKTYTDKAIAEGIQKLRDIYEGKQNYR